MKKMIIFTFIISILLTSCVRNKIKDAPVNPALEVDYISANPDSLYMVANKLYQDGKFVEAAKTYEEGLRYDVNNSNSLYNLACCYGLAGDSLKSERYLKLALKRGFKDYTHVLEDTDFDKVKDSTQFIELFTKLLDYLNKNKSEDVLITYNIAGVHLKNYIHLPKDFDKEKEHKLFIGLHGWGDTAEAFSNLWKSYDEPDFILACPEAPFAFLSGDKIGYSWFDWSDDKEYSKATEDELSKYVRSVIERMKLDYKISEVYLIGFSQGCGLSYVTGIQNYDLINGIICFGGWLDDRITVEEIEKAKDLMVYIAHGKNDKVVEPKNSDVAYERLSPYCKSIRINRFEGVHQIERNALKEAIDWMLN
jgi:phospholipase/carboxylesterase